MIFLAEDMLGSYTAPVKRAERKIVGRETEMRRVKAALMRPELCNVMLLADAGSGKANPVDTYLPVADSRNYIKLGDIQPGDYVFDEFGRPTEVLGVYPQGKLRKYLVFFENGAEVACNDEHLWNVRTLDDIKNGRGYKTLTLREIMASGERYYIPRAKAVERPDGEIKSCPGVSLDASRGTGVIDRAVYGRSIEQRMAVMRLLVEQFGRISMTSGKIQYQIAVRCRYLAHDIQKLAATLGMVTYFSEVDWQDLEPPADGLFLVTLDIDFSTALDLFEKSSCRDLICHYAPDCVLRESGYDDLRIMGVMDTGLEVEMLCIYVAGESHLFQISEHHIVTHNTALVQGLMLEDPKRRYLEVDLSRMIADSKDSNEMAAKLKLLFDQVADQVQSTGTEIVLFIDEFHQIVQLSAAAVEALKPLLADSGTRGIRVIAATTYIEFRKWISPNQPLVERLQRINLPEPDKKTVIAILKGMADRYDVGPLIVGDGLYELIYEYTNRYIPANAQPRKSILIMDAMIGWYRSTGRQFDDHLLADVMYESEGVNVAFRANASEIREQLDKRVLSQQFATKMIEQRLHICIADLNKKSKPMSSFLFSGSTGTGKTEITKSLAEALFGSEDAFIRFDMTEFANPDSLERFRAELTNRVWARPFSILLLDEIEKACAPVTRLLLQVLDDGRLSDENNRVVSFLNCYIVMTTNAGSEVYQNISQYNADDDGSGEKIMQYYKVIRESIASTTGDNRFPPELLGRIDVIVPFQPLSEETMKKIAAMNLRKMMANVRQRHGVEIAMDKKVIRYLVEDNLDTNSDSGGARVVISKLESEVTIPIAKFINEHPRVKRIKVFIEGDLVRDNENMRVSDAHVVVKPVA